MAIDLRQVLTATKVVDGSWAGELDRLGCPPGYCREAWNLSHVEEVTQVASSYVQAGVDVLLTNTAGANRFMLERYGLADQAAAISRAGAQISRQVAAGTVWVFGAMGPSGRMVIAEEVSPDDLYKAFQVQANALAAGGVDAIVCQGMSEMAEALAAVRAVKDATGLPVVASMTFDSGVDFMRTTMGVEAAEAAEQLTKAGVDVIGGHCGATLDSYIKLAQCMHQHSDLPVWVKPNAALPDIVGDKVVYRESPEEFAAKAHMLLHAGANFIGGCCGITPSHIANVVKALRPWLSAG